MEALVARLGGYYGYLLGRFDDKQIMEAPASRSPAGSMRILPKDQVAQKDNVQAMFIRPCQQQHHPHSGSRGLKALELIVIADPHPTT
jgi:formate dehydrogenase major subunit